MRAIPPTDRKSTRLNSSHVAISYAVFCLKKKKNEKGNRRPLGNRWSVRDTTHRHRAPCAARQREPVLPARHHRLRLDFQLFFFFKDRAPPEISPLPHHDAFPI